MVVKNVPTTFAIGNGSLVDRYNIILPIIDLNQHCNIVYFNNCLLKWSFTRVNLLLQLSVKHLDMIAIVYYKNQCD